MSAELKELHEQLLEITEKTLQVCERENIPCYLAWGSCLGAARHQNIIPWDDDIDLYVPLQDLEKVKKAFQGDPVYFYQDIRTDPDYPEAWPKIRKNGTTSMDRNRQALQCHWGICIDLFPLLSYNKPRMDGITTLKTKVLLIAASFPYYQKAGTKFTHKIWSGIYGLMGKKGREKLFRKLLASCERPGDYYLDLFSGRRDVCLHKADFGRGTYLPFGPMDAPVLRNYKDYLKTVYGSSWMEIPPEDSPLRYCHSSSLIDCRRDYREYQKDTADQEGEYSGKVGAN